MRQVFCTHAAADPTETVTLVDAPEPTCPSNGVVVAVQARPINPADLLLLQGRHAFTPDYPAPVGIEGAGRVVEAGESSRLHLGDLVAIPFGGTWRERMALADDDVLPLPSSFDLEQAAMLSVNPVTAAGLIEGVPSGACIALNAATSAVSALVLALCRARGIAALAVVRDASSAERLRARGAHAVVVDGPELGTELRKVAPAPIARALDAVAGDASGRLLEALDEGGELVVYGLLADDRVRLPATQVVFRDVTVRGYSRLRVLKAMMPARRAELTAELVALVARGELASSVEARYPLEQVREALAHHERPGRRGKILLTSDGDAMLTN
jgi:trans-2-enoyl-CoA reductase